MAKHACPRCGFESSRDRWWDQHPVAAVSFGLPAGFVLVCVMLAYPWFTIPATIIVCAWWVDRRMRQRQALAARADHDHRELMTRHTFAPKTSPGAVSRRSTVDLLPRRGAKQLAQQHVLMRWPTTPIPTQPIRRNR